MLRNSQEVMTHNPNRGQTLAYSKKLELSRILYTSFTIAWGIAGVMILALLSVTDYSDILKENKSNLIFRTSLYD